MAEKNNSKKDKKENKTKNEHQIIVGIGASAGGLTAIEEFFKNMPPESGLSFVVIQHLAPDHDSMLPNILQRSTNMQVVHIEDDMKVENNTIYVLPPGHDIDIENSHLKLQKQDTPRSVPLPIDHFFRSLKSWNHEKSIGIILSGTGSDGTQGVKEIKSEHGMVMAQDPDTADHKGMPDSAINTGLVDFILSPTDMPERLVEFVDNSLNKPDGEKPFQTEENEDHVKEIFKILKKNTKHDFSEYKYSTIFRRIDRRMAVNTTQTLEEYIDLLKNNVQEADSLFNEFLIGVTSFFRDYEAFKALENKVLSEIVPKNTDDPFRVWVAGCSTGEEAYSIAILIDKILNDNNINRDVQIFASDIDDKSLETARLGKYPLNIEADVPSELLSRYFKKHDSYYLIKKELREMIVFANHSILKDPPYSRLDLICCRNLLIYMQNSIQNKTKRVFHYALKKDGFLFLGNSESVGSSKNMFSTVDSKYKIYKKEEIGHKSDLLWDFGHTYDDSSNKAPDKDKKGISLKEFSEKTALEKFTNPLVIINKNGDILYSLGRVKDYFEFVTGEPDYNIVNAASDGLKVPLANGIRKLKYEKQELHYDNVRVKDGDHSEIVKLTIYPIEKPSSLNNLFIVYLEPHKVVHLKGVESTKSESGSKEKDEYIKDVEQELSETRSYLQNVIEELETSNEELKSANEEAQSSNEELQSSNEKLETSKEELQSLNEELETSNNELKRKVDELTKVNNDINNFLSSTQIATIFLDKEMNIQRFTPSISKIMDLRESDIGRPVKSFVTSLNYDGLVDDAHEVLRNLIPKETEVTISDEQYYWMRILPYRTLEDKIEGVVITFTDITDKINHERNLKASEKKFRSLFNNMVIGVSINKLSKGNDQEDPFAEIYDVNSAFEKILGKNAKELVGQKVKDVCHFCDENSIKEIIDKIKKGQNHQAEIYYEKQDQHYKVISFPLQDEQFVMSVQDITQEKKEILARQHLVSIVESSEDAIYSISLKGKIITWNSGAERFYGYASKEILGKDVAILSVDFDMKQHLSLIKKVKKGEKVAGLELQQKTKDGSIVSVSLTKSPIYNEKGKTVAISDIVKDISNIKERESELIRAKEKTEKAGMLKTAFLQNISHEIRTPMNSILGFTDILKNKITDDELSGYTHTIEQSGKQLIRLIDDILDISRMEAGELTIEKSNFNLDNLLNNLKKQLEGLKKQNNKDHISLYLKTPEKSDKTLLYSDRYRMQQILSNLLSNALKYTEKGSIEFGYEFKQDNLLFFVEDSGKGIDKNYHKRIFERFRRIESGDEKVFSGTGLGLSISKGLVENLGGEIWVDSDLKEGSTFYFTIPYAVKDGNEEFEDTDEEENSQAPDLTGKTVLVAEDDEFSYQMLDFMLQETNAKVLFAKNGDEAIDHLKENYIDVALLDIRLPKKSGYKILDFIKNQDLEIKVIAQTAYAMPEERKKSLDAGFDEHLKKPLSSKVLYQTLNKFIKKGHNGD